MDEPAIDASPLRAFHDPAYVPLAKDLSEENMLLRASERSGEHDYHGPTSTGDDGVKRPIPDPTHEQFHRAVGDVLAGKVIPAARRQMQEALKNTPPLKYKENVALVKKYRTEIESALQ
jgi:hypothetical protein